MVLEDATTKSISNSSVVNSKKNTKDRKEWGKKKKEERKKQQRISELISSKWSLTNCKKDFLPDLLKLYAVQKVGMFLKV